MAQTNVQAFSGDVEIANGTNHSLTIDASSSLIYNKVLTFTSISADSYNYVGRFSIYAPPAIFSIVDSGSSLGSGSRYSMAKQYGAGSKPIMNALEGSLFTDYTFVWQANGEESYDVWFKPNRAGNYIVYVHAKDYTFPTAPGSPTYLDVLYGLVNLSDSYGGLAHAIIGAPSAYGNASLQLFNNGQVTGDRLTHEAIQLFSNTTPATGDISNVYITMTPSTVNNGYGGYIEGWNKAGTDSGLTIGSINEGTKYAGITVVGTTANVGIGTTAPNAKLHIKSSSGADGIAIFNPAGGTGGTLALSSGVRGGILISNSGGGSNGTDDYSSQPIVLSGGGTAATDGNLRGGSIWSMWGGSQYGLGFKGANDGDAVPEGGSAPTLFVTSDKVGIGVVSPNAKLEVVSDSQNATSTTTPDSQIVVKCSNASGAVGTGGGITFSQRYSSGAGELIATGGIFGARLGGTNGSYGGGLLFKTTASGGGSMSDRMVITRDGNVGIGTDAPAAPLQITNLLNCDTWSLAQASLKIGHLPAAQANHYGLSIGVSASHGDGVIQTYNQAQGAMYDLQLQPVSGNVGIGTTDPGTTLDVNGNLRIRTRLYMATESNFGHLYKEVKAGAGNITFTVPMRAYCNWLPAIVKLKASRCYGSGGGHESWRWNFAFRYLNCSGSDGQRIIESNLDGSNPGTGYLVESYGASNNYYSFTFIIDGRNNMIAEVEMIAFGGIYF